MARISLASLLAAALLASVTATLGLYLNPRATLGRDGPGMLLALFLPQLVVGGLGVVALSLGAAVLRGRSPRRAPVLVGLPHFAGLAGAVLTAAVALYAYNMWSYRYSVPEPHRRALVQASVLLALCVIVLACVVIDALVFPHRSRVWAAPVTVLAAGAGLALPLALRPAPPAEPSPLPPPLASRPLAPASRVTLIGVDGLGPDTLRQGVEEGRLAALSQMLRRGGFGPLGSLRPAEGPPLWTTILTGRYPRDHGIHSFSAYRLLGSPSLWPILPKAALLAQVERLGLARRAGLTAASRRRRALWEVLNAFGIETGVVRFWATHPPQRVRGFLLSNAFHEAPGSRPGGASPLHPPDLLADLQPSGPNPAEMDPALLSEFVEAPERPAAFPWREELVDKALAPDLAYHRAGRALRAAYDPPFFATSVQGLDVVGHVFLRYALPDRFGDVPADDARRFGRVFPRYLELVDQWVGEALARRRRDEVVLVVSAHGMEPASLPHRLAEAVIGSDARGGTHAGAPEGVLLALGQGIRPGASLRVATVLDVMPTVLYLMGLPVARDLEGRVLGEMVEAGFAATHPVSYILSYEGLVPVPTMEGVPPSPPVPEERRAGDDPAPSARKLR